MTDTTPENDLSELLPPLLSSARATAGLQDTQLDSQVMARLGLYLDLLESWNEKMDLVAPAPRAVLVERHLVDCLIAGELTFSASSLPVGSNVLDVGSGAGLPGVVWAICFPAYYFTLCEPREKRSLFLKEVKRTLGLSHVTVVTARFDDMHCSPVRFNLVTARALGHQSEFLKLASEILRPPGWVAQFVGAEVSELPVPEGLEPPRQLPYSLAQDSPGRGRRIVLWEGSEL